MRLLRAGFTPGWRLAQLNCVVWCYCTASEMKVMFMKSTSKHEASREILDKVYGNCLTRPSCRGGPPHRKQEPTAALLDDDLLVPSQSKAV